MDNKELKNKEQDKAIKVSKVSIAVNIALSLLKLFVGLLASSMALISDAIHSASDVLSTVVVMIGIKLSARESDDDHQYGHERLECVAAIVLASILFATGGAIGVNGIKDIFTKSYLNYTAPGLLAAVAALLSIAVKEWMYHYTVNCAKEVGSSAMMADAWHHRSDALSSIGSLAGVVGARMGYLICDSLASIVICFFIMKAAIDIFKDATDRMVDKACPQEVVDKMKQVIISENGVLGIDEIRTRMFGSQVYVDVEIAVDGNKTLWLSHDIAEQVHYRIEKEFPKVKHIMVHVNPYEED